MRLAGDRGKRTGLGYPGESAQRSDQVHYFLGLRKDEFQESRIIFARQEVYLTAIAKRTARLTIRGAIEPAGTAEVAAPFRGERP